MVPFLAQSPITLSFKTSLDCALFFILLFKLGLPPFVIWKIYVFEKAPILFIFFYNIPYFFFLFLNLLYLILLFKFTLLGINYIILISALLISLIIISIVSLKTNNWGSFFAISSSLTSLFLLLVIVFASQTFMSTTSTNFSVFKPTTLLLLPYINYFYFYIISLAVLIPYLAQLNILHGSITIAALSRTSNCFKSVFYETKTLLFVLFASLAGLPPFSSFFAKLFLVNTVTSTNNPLIPFFLFFLLYLFVMLLFYFKSSKFLLTQKNLTRIPHIAFSTVAQPRGTLDHGTLIFLWFIVFGFFIFNDVMLFITI